MVPLGQKAFFCGLPAWFGRLLQKPSCAQEYICASLLLLNSFLRHIENQENETALTLQCNSPLEGLTDSPPMISGGKKDNKTSTDKGTSVRLRLVLWVASTVWEQEMGCFPSCDGTSRSLPSIRWSTFHLSVIKIGHVRTSPDFYSVSTLIHHFEPVCDRWI